MAPSELATTVETRKGRKPTAAGLCPICRRLTAPKDFVSDHCHATEITREYICRTCNAGLGMFHDDPKALKRAAAYISMHRARANCGHLDELLTQYRFHPRA